MSIQGEIKQNKYLAIVVICVLILAVYFFINSLKEDTYILKMTAGAAEGRRHQLAEILAEVGANHHLKIDLSPTTGSFDAALHVASGDFDVAFVQGDLNLDPRVRQNIRQVATLHAEPLHLLVKPEISAENLIDLKGKRLNLSTKGSGTRELANKVLAFTGLEAINGDFRDTDFSYSELKELSYEELPDGIFTVSSLPSPVALHLVRTHGYQLIPLPFGEALSLQYFSIHDALVPAYTYGVAPAVPEESIHSVATRLLIITNKKTSIRAIKQLLEVMYDSDYARKADLPYLDESALTILPEFPFHDGTIAYKKRDKPVVTGDFLEGLENLRSFLVSIIVGFFLLTRWNLRRQRIGFEKYIEEVSSLEKEINLIEQKPSVSMDELFVIRKRLSQLKNEALKRFVEGELKGEEFMSSFLTHVTDVRDYLNELLLYERRRIDKTTRRKDPKENEST